MWCLVQQVTCNFICFMLSFPVNLICEWQALCLCFLGEILFTSCIIAACQIHKLTSYALSSNCCSKCKTKPRQCLPTRKLSPSLNVCLVVFRFFTKQKHFLFDFRTQETNSYGVKFFSRPIKKPQTWMLYFKTWWLKKWHFIWRKNDHAVLLQMIFFPPNYGRLANRFLKVNNDPWV